MERQGPHLHCKRSLRQVRGKPTQLVFAVVLLSCIAAVCRTEQTFLRLDRVQHSSAIAQRIAGGTAEVRSIRSTATALRAKGKKERQADTEDQKRKAFERVKKDDVIEMEGEVLSICHNNFKVELENGAEVDATLAGKLRMNRIKVYPGDAVTVEMSPFDLTKGRIIFRTIKLAPGMEPPKPGKDRKKR
eukprot:TRINITY_DN112577_c0_g1_i1.p1 TRINITY_DN112577_c0_g1~~TRINITY_DN112577_c0_g1_i1.p1  ORF type:complete len:189 (+),score=39.47 TRINITY_DN112577_c0_g1_i1:56-622(+)